jgi:dTMP kinase
VNPKKLGKFIVIDGLGKSGKTSIIKTLEEKLPSTDNQFVFTREPGETDLGNEIRNILLQGKYEMDALTHILMFSAIRNYHILNKVRPAILSGMNVVTDRFDSSTWAYNVVGDEGGHRYKTLFSLIRNEVVTQCEPDFHIILDVNAKTAYERHQTAKTDSEKDKFDDKPLAYFERVRKGFLHYAEICKPRSVVIDANRRLDDVAMDVYVAVMKALR